MFVLDNHLQSPAALEWVQKSKFERSKIHTIVFQRYRN